MASWDSLGTQPLQGTQRHPQPHRPMSKALLAPSYFLTSSPGTAAPCFHFLFSLWIRDWSWEGDEQLGGDPKKHLFYEQVTDGAGTSRGPSNLSDSEASVGGSSLEDRPRLFPPLGVPLGVQVPPKQSKKNQRGGCSV